MQKQRGKGHIREAKQKVEIITTAALLRPTLDVLLPFPY